MKKTKILAFALAAILSLTLLLSACDSDLIQGIVNSDDPQSESSGSSGGDRNDSITSESPSYPFKESITTFVPSADDETVAIGMDEISSGYAMLVDITDGKVIASRKSASRIYPASMTKVMSLIVIAENLKSEASLDEKVTITQELIDRKISEQHSGDLNTVGEVLTVEDLIYAFALKSDGMAGIALAQYIAGSETEFVKLMNSKAKEIGLENTLFQNCTGIHHQYHYTTPADMAAIMIYAMNNSFCAEVLSSPSYRTTTNVYESGITFYHGVLVDQIERPGLYFKTVSVTAGKTGWTGSDSGACIVSFATGKTSGHKYVLVTADAYKTNYSESMMLARNDMKYIFDTYAN